MHRNNSLKPFISIPRNFRLRKREEEGDGGQTGKRVSTTTDAGEGIKETRAGQTLSFKDKVFVLVGNLRDDMERGKFVIER